MNVLLTGGSGLLGRTLTPMLIENGFNVTHYDLHDPEDGQPFIQGDLLDAEAIQRASSGQDVIMHIAALHGPHWREAGDARGFTVNVQGTQNVLTAAVQNDVKRVIFTSSIWATGHGNGTPTLPIDENMHREPRELYGLTKILNEHMCRYFSANTELSTIVLRPGGIRPADLFDPRNPGYLIGCVDVRDVAQAHRLALNLPADVAHEVFIVTADPKLDATLSREFANDPVAALERAHPGVRQLIDDGSFDVNRLQEWYTVEKARKVLGYKPQYNFSIQ